MSSRNWELLILLAFIAIALLSPMWYLADSKGLDEAIKSGAGLTQGGLVLAGYKLFKGKSE